MVTKPLIREYLKGLHCTLWLNWDLTQAESLDQAVDFVYDLWHTLEKLAQPPLDLPMPFPRRGTVNRHIPPPSDYVLVSSETVASFDVV